MRGVLFVTLIVSIIAWASCQVQEIPYQSLGTPINDTVGANELKYYVIDIDSVLGAVTDREQQITFALTSYAGDADLFISTQGPPNVEVQTHECRNCILKGSTPRSEIQQIKKSSALFPTGTGQKFHIAVMGYAVAAEYTFNLFADRLTILDGFPQTGMSKASKYVYFEYTKISDEPFKIVVTPFNGDPDLYVSQSKSDPTAIEHTWMSASTSGDIITIDPTKAPATSQNKYFIGVRAFFDSYYTVHVSSLDTYTKTIEGVAIFDRLESNKVGLFKVDVLKAQTVTIQTIPKSYRGDPDIYVSDDVSRFPPGPGNYLYARSTAGDDELSFRAEAKTYYIGIKAFNRATDFEIIVTGENHDAELVDGISQKHNNTDINTIKYFKYVHADPDNGVGFSVKPSVPSSGSNFRLYIAKPESGNRRPGPSKHDVEAAPQSTNPEVKTANWRAPSPVGTFFLGVQGFGSFDVAVNTNVSYTYLQESSTVYGLSVGYGFYKYFIFEADQFSTQDFSVAVNPSQGDVDIFVSTELEKPTTSRYTWMSNGWNKDTVYVPSNDAKAKGKSRFYVGVYGASSSGTSYFNIVAFQSGSQQIIEDGVDVRGAVGVQKYIYYKYTTPVGGSLTISLKLTGTDEDADIYVSTTTPKPSKLDFTYRSIDYGDDVIVIDDSYTTTYYIAVYGLLANADSGISYTLSVQQNYHTINVNSYYGGAMSYTPRAKIMQFKARIYSHVEQVLISLTLVNGRTRMYLNTNETDATNANHQLLKWGWPSNSILITKDDPMFRSGLWSIGVDAFEPSSYYLTVSTPPSRTYLTESRPTIQAVAANSMNLYSYMVPYNASRLNNTLALRVMDGSVDLYVNYGYTIPTRQNHTLQVRGRTNALLILPSEEYSGLYLTIAAYGGSNPHNYFSLLLSTGNDYQTLLDDQPQEHQTRANLGYNRFQVIKGINTTEAHVSVGVESCDISPAPVAYLSETNKDVTENDKQASTFAVGSHGYVQVGRLTGTDKGAKEPSFYVGVRSADHMVGQRYVIYTTTRQDHRPIRKDSDQLSGHFENDVLVVRMSNATVKVNYHKTLYYDLYMYRPHDQHKSIIDQSNMYTVCGIKSYGRRVATYSGTALPEIRLPLASNAMSNSDTFAVSVIVHDGRGLESAYNPGFVMNGVFYPDFPGFDRKVSVGGILILVAALLLAIYLIAGMIFNFVKGERGIRVIPNFDFWRILPGLIKDGVMFIATCGKKSSDYGTLDLPTTFAPASVNTAQPTVVDKSSYGSI